MNWKDLNPPPKSANFVSADPNDSRMKEFVEPVSESSRLTANIPCFLSYPDDLGIQLSKGRPGSHLSSISVRNHLFKMTWPKINKTMLYDLGSINSESAVDLNLNCKNEHNTHNEHSVQNIHYDGTQLNTNITYSHPAPLQMNPELASQVVEKNHRKAQAIVQNYLPKHPMITLGGGHDYGFADGAAFIETFGTKATLQSDQNSAANLKPLIINFDAHLDVRPTTWGTSSGTPFYRLLTKYPNQFQFIEWGLQKQCNSSTHWTWAKDHNAELISVDDIRKIGTIPLLKGLLQGTSKKQKCYISLDIDVFGQGFAPGCSQSWDSGLSYDDIYSALKWLFENKDVQLFSIYEVSPPLDVDHKTSKLAAQLIHFYLSHREKENL